MKELHIQLQSPELRDVYFLVALEILFFAIDARMYLRNLKASVRNGSHVVGIFLV